MLRLVAGLTVYLVLVDVLVLLLTSSAANPTLADTAEVAAIFVYYSFVLGMLLRWPLVLTLLIRGALAHGTTAMAMGRIAVVVVVHALLGILSMTGGVALWIGKPDDQVVGLFFNAFIPSAVVWYLWRAAAPVVPSERSAGAWARS